MEDKTQHRLATEMDIALMKAHFRLDISQMMDKDIQAAFQRVQLVQMKLIVGTKHSCNQTDRPAYPATILFPTIHFNRRRIIDIGFDDPEASVDHDHDVHNQPPCAEYCLEAVLQS